MAVEHDRFAIDDLVPHDLPDGTVVARNRRNGAQMHLPGEVYNAITHCDAFRTMDEHIAHIAGPAARGREGEIRDILQNVINGGLAISAAAIAAALRPDNQSAVTEAPVAAILTCDRPAALARLLESIHQGCEVERLRQLVVIDDSRSQASITANGEAVERSRDKLAARGLRSVLHFAPERAVELVDGLVRQLPQHETGIRHLLDRRGREHEVTTGISRNLAQLLSVGRPLLVFDDDILCQWLSSPDPAPGVEFSSSPRACRFYAADQDWRDRQGGPAHCPVQAHLQVLGSTLATSLNSLNIGQPGPDAFENATSGFARRITPGSRVLVSECGAYGDPGSGGNEWIALLPAESRDQVEALVGDLRHSQATRNCWLGRNHAVFQPRANMSQLTGLDNRGYLPPYVPLFRGQDRNFGAMVEFIFPGSLAADLPFALPHLPEPRRSWQEGYRGFKLPFSLQHLFNDHVSGLTEACLARDPLNRNEWLATLFFDLSDAPADAIMESAAGHWTRQRIDWMTRLASALNVPPGTAVPMGDYIRDIMAELRSARAPAFDPAMLKGPPDDQPGDAVLEYWRGAYRDFAAGLRAWPEIRDEMRSGAEL